MSKTLSNLDRRQFLAASVSAYGALAAAAENSRPYPEQLYDIYPVPPLARRNDAKRSIDFAGNERLFRFLRDGGVTRFVYGGNAFLYQITLAEYTELTHWLGGLASQATIIPAVGSSYGRAIDQAALIRRYKFPSVLVLPTGDPRDAAGLEQGMREIAQACGVPLSLYVKREADFGDDLAAGIETIGRLVDDKVCVSIKYAVVRKDPAVDPYLTALLRRVDAKHVVSGIGERPAIVHLRDFGLSGFTTGSGVIAPRLCRALLDACARKDYEQAVKIRAAFLPLEDLRDEWGPPRVIHAAVALAGIAETGPIPPFVSELSAAQKDRLRPVARELLKRDSA